MKCLSVNQPFAELIVSGAKDVENRSWQTHHRGLLVIHAGMKFNPTLLRWAKMSGWIEENTDLVYGFAIGVAELVNVYEAHDPRCVSQWAQPGYFHWILERPRRFPEPVPMKGRLSLFEPPDDLRAVLEMAVEQAQ